MSSVSAELLVVVVSLGVASCISEHPSGYFDMFDRCDDRYGTVLYAFYTPLLGRCCVNCLLNSDCFSVVYNPRTKICTTNAGRTTGFPTGCRATVKYLPLKKSPDRSVLYDDCVSDDDCTTANSRCYNGTCQCLWGYSYNPANVSCLTECDTYGSTFSMVENHYLYKHNHYTIKNSNRDECKQRCVTHTEFVCRSFEYFEKRVHCYLSNSKATTHGPNRLRKTTRNQMRDYYQRNCE